MEDIELLKKQISDLQAELAQAKKNAEDASKQYLQALDDLNKEKETSEAFQAELEKTMLTPTLAEVILPKIPEPVKFEGKTYTFHVIKFNLEGKEILAEQAVKDKEVLAKLVKIGFGGWSVK